DALAERALAEQPSRQNIGLSEAVVRDVVSVTIRDIVGIFESLLDRLLIEKKTETIRSMVVEFMTEDISATIAAGQEELKEQEIGHVLQDVRDLRSQMNGTEQAWEQRFDQVGELERALNSSNAESSNRFASLEARLRELEGTSVRHNALDLVLKDIAQDKENKTADISELFAKDEDTQRHLAELQHAVSSSLATKKELHEATQQVLDDMHHSSDEVTETLKELQSNVAWRTDVEDLDLRQRQKVTAVLSEVHKAQEGLKELGERFDAAQQQNHEVFARNVQVREMFSQYGELMEDLEKRLTEEQRKLDQQKVEKQDLQDKMSSVYGRMEELKVADEHISNGLRELAGMVTDLQAHTADMATRGYAEEVARKYADEVVRASTEKEEIDALRRDFIEEQERIRANVRQQQNNRRDLNAAIEELNDLRAKSVKVDKRCNSLEEGISSLKKQEAENWDTMQDTLNSQAHTYEDLKNTCEALRLELNEHAEKQQTEGERLRDQSTRQYLEQLDKALELQGKLNKLQLSHQELDATVKTHFPGITSAATFG
ncbi:LAMB1, partial [Symbiodinium pilosum]